MANVHLICGIPSAGKTTYSAFLKTGTNGVHFVLDHWLVTAYGRYVIDAVGGDEHVRRVLACRKLIWDIAQELLSRDVDVILDDGFFYREHRAQYAKMAQMFGADTLVHFVNTPKDIIEARLQKRNSALPENNFSIGRSLLDECYDMFDVPSSDEGICIVEIDGNSEKYNRGVTACDISMNRR